MRCGVARATSLTTYSSGSVTKPPALVALVLSRAVHGSGRVGFVPNPDSTRLHRVGEKFNP